MLTSFIKTGLATFLLASHCLAIDPQPPAAPAAPPPSRGDEHTFQCPNAGYFCATIRPRPYGLSTFALQSPASPLIVLNSQPELTHGGGGGGGGGGRRDEIAKFYACASSNARSVPIAQCPQNQCVQGYCAGGGPATVPRRLRGGDGLYCGRTIIHQLRRRRPGPALASDEAESPLKGGGDAFTVATNPTAPGRGGGGGDDSYDEYINDNLYYFAGSQGINLGPCETHCISAGRGQADYCEV